MELKAAVGEDGVAHSMTFNGGDDGGGHGLFDVKVDADAAFGEREDIVE